MLFLCSVHLCYRLRSHLGLTSFFSWSNLVNYHLLHLISYLRYNLNDFNYWCQTNISSHRYKNPLCLVTSWIPMSLHMLRTLKVLEVFFLVYIYTHICMHSHIYICILSIWVCLSCLLFRLPNFIILIKLQMELYIP